MAEATQVMFTHREVVTALLKNQGIHEGIWGLAVQFGFGVANTGPNDNEINPTGMLPVLGIGIQRFPQMNALSVDAAEVNPAEPAL
ncbi:hypothetical protein Q8F57_003080 [Paraburkholderia terrae]|uniref:hypothetical protein n=1 Tax=Paraburkholderia terrae TaxID=311230 RepID=UPI00296B4C8F|nr:hypothetical protein [Paraburkholderia terrae]MDW3655492.1 hypothetical protein [Paraburkholderia terrae]